MAYPGSQTNLNYPNTEFIIQAYPIGFKMIAYSGTSYFSLNASAYNTTHYSISVATWANNSLIEIYFSVVSFDRAAITANYTYYIDIILYNTVGNQSYNFGDMFAANQYMYRNGLSGAVHVQFLFTMNASIAQSYYYSVTSTINDLIVFRGFNHRKRICPTGYNYYQPSNVTCWDACPAYN
jgi:hypothetical protein